MTLDLSWHREARVWVGELPLQLPDPVHEVGRMGMVEHKLGTDRRAAAVELYIPKGARILYALLGAEFQPTASQQLSVQLPLASAEGELLDWSLVNQADEVRAGLPEEYRNAVTEGVLEARAGDLLGSGTLQFTCAAHGRVGSSQDLFRRLARIVVHVLCLDPLSVSEAALVELLEHQLAGA